MRVKILLLSAILAVAACQTMPVLQPQPQAPVAVAFNLREAQTALKNLGYYRGRVDGVSGPSTRRAVRQCQADFARPQTGEMDGVLYALMQKYLHENPPHPDLPVAADVFALQRALTRLGYYKGPADGRFVGETLKAYLVYQRREGLDITYKLEPRRLRRIEAAAARVSG